jgi:hypothetical protein
MWYGSHLSVVAMMVGFMAFRKAFGPILYPLVFLSRDLSEGTW